MMAAAGIVLQERHVIGIRSPPSKLSCCMCEDVEATVLPWLTISPPRRTDDAIWLHHWNRRCDVRRAAVTGGRLLPAIDTDLHGGTGRGPATSKPRQHDACLPFARRAEHLLARARRHRR